MSRFFKIILVAGIISVACFFLMLSSFFGMVGTLAGNSWEMNPDLAKPHIALLKIEGPIYSSETILKHLDKIRGEENCKGILVRLETPGGAVAASQEIFQALKNLKEKYPVVVSMANTAASGGYYVALAGSKIFSNSGTLTGSIGVIAQFPEVKNLMDKIGVSMTVIKSGDLKDAGSPFRDLSQEERQYFQHVIDDTYGQFLADVKSSRGLSDQDLKGYVDGRVFTGKEAAEVRLVDTLGTLADAKNYIARETGLGPDPKFIEPHTGQVKWLEALGSKFPGKTPGVVEAMEKLLPSGLYYLWPLGTPKIP